MVITLLYHCVLHGYYFAIALCITWLLLCYSTVYYMVIPLLYHCVLHGYYFVIPLYISLVLFSYNTVKIVVVTKILSKICELHTKN